MKRSCSQDPNGEVVQKLRQFAETMDPASYEPIGPKIRSSIDHRFDQGNLIILVHGDTKGSVTSETSAELIDPEYARSKFNVSVSFMGKNSLLVIHDDIVVKGCRIEIGEKGLAYFGRKFKARFAITINLKNQSGTLIFGDNCNIGSTMIFAGDEKDLEVIVGSDFISAINMKVRASDGHTIYLADDPQSVVNQVEFGVHIGRHVWVGMDVLISKDAVVPDNCVVGARSLVTSHRYEANAVIAGIPAKVIKKGINWDNRPIYKYKRQRP